jgi:hypothetical protein
MDSGGPILLSPLTRPPALPVDAGRQPVLPQWPHLMVDVQLVVFPSLQGLVQVQVALDCVILKDVAPAPEKGS